MPSRHNDKPGIRISSDSFQSFFKRLADHGVCPCSSGIICEFRPVLQHCHCEAQHLSDADNRHGHMSSAADDQPGSPSDALAENRRRAFIHSRSCIFHSLSEGIFRSRRTLSAGIFPGPVSDKILFSRMTAAQDRLRPDIAGTFAERLRQPDIKFLLIQSFSLHSVFPPCRLCAFQACRRGCQNSHFAVSSAHTVSLYHRLK